MLYRHAVASLVFVAITACAPEAVPPAAPPAAAAPAKGVDGVACVGAIVTPPAGLDPVEDAALLQKALDASGKGKLCTGKVFEAKTKVVVYRVWNKDKSYTQLGGWWSLTPPKGPVDKYRVEEDICPEWSDLNVVSQCTLKVGAHVVIGPGQSADCTAVKYPKSAANQVFVANDTRATPPQVFVEGCTDGAAWP
jgi:hypothetical protein